MHEPIFDNVDREFGDLITLLEEREVQPEDRAMRWLTGGVAAVIAAMTGGYLMAVSVG